MERRGIYRKGSAGHVRNINIYRLYMQRIKRWRTPLTAVLAIMLVFGMAPIVGDQFQASVLTTPEQTQFQTTDPASLKKALLGVLKNFVNDCDRFRIKTCVDQGNKLINNITLAQPADARKFVPTAEDFALNFEEEIALNVCKYDLGNAMLQSKSTQKVLDNFLEKYSESLDVSNLMPASASMTSANDVLRYFVNSCEVKLMKK